MIRILFYIIILLTLPSTTAFAQKVSPEFERFKAPYSGKEFQYTVNEQQRPESNAFLDFFLKIVEFLAKLPWGLIFTVLVSLLVIYILYRLVKQRTFYFLREKSSDSKDATSVLEESLEKTDYKRMIQSAEEQQNYPLALRYLFYQNLRDLDRLQLINYQPKKTNRQFLYEINKASIATAYERNMHAYNHYWFGKNPINTEQYIKEKEYFLAFNQSLNS